MKKVLLTSTALVAFSGAAVADVALTGRAEMGLYGTSLIGNAQFFTDIDVTFTMTGETDNGLTFGASVDLDEADGTAATGVSGATGNNSDDGGATIFISGSFGTITMGDTDGALDWALTEAGNVGNPGSIADDETSHAGYLGSYLDGTSAGSRGDGQILRWDYSSGAFGVAVSVEDDNGSNAANTNLGYAIGLKYDLAITGGTVSFGVGHQRAADNTGLPAPGTDVKMTGLSVSGAFDNGLSAGVTYTDLTNSAIDKHYSVGLGYTTGPISVHFNYGKMSGVAANTDRAGYGLAAAYDLGGGAVIHAGYSRDDIDGAAFNVKRASIGLGLSF